jgi:hypothetical protein
MLYKHFDTDIARHVMTLVSRVPTSKPEDRDAISRCLTGTPTTNVSATVGNRTILNDSLTNSAAKIGGSCWCPATSKIPPYQPRW